MIEPVHRNPPARRRRSFTLDLRPRDARRMARAWSRRRTRAEALARIGWGLVAVLLYGAMLAMFLYSAFLAPPEWNAADPDYRPGAADAR